MDGSSWGGTDLGRSLSSQHAVDSRMVMLMEDIHGVHIVAAYSAMLLSLAIILKVIF